MGRRVLVIPTGGLRREGITSSILNFMRSMDCDGLDVRVAAVYNNEPDVLGELRSLGCEVVETPDRRSETPGYARFLLSYMRRERIDLAHVHGSNSVMAIELRCAQLAGVRERIAHSHNTKSDDARRDKMLRPVFRGSWTRALACGVDAGRWLFEDRSFEVLHNGFTLGRYAFDAARRTEARSRLGLGGETAVGFVGNINYVKNQAFLIDVFGLLSRDVPGARLFIVGEGPDRAKIEGLVAERGLGDRVTITGRVPNVDEYLQALDLMMLPSLFEGLPSVVLEWQAAGLPCMVSDVVTRECAVTPLVRFLSLEDGAAAWAACARDALAAAGGADTRLDASRRALPALREHGFDIDEASKRLKTIYLGGE